MGAEEAVQRALVARVVGLPVFDGAPVRADYPYVVVGEGGSGDWSGQGLDGREVRTALTLWVEAGDAAGLLEGGEALVAAGRGLGPDLAGGWRVASAVLMRTRTVKAARAVGDADRAPRAGGEDGGLKTWRWRREARSC